MDFERFGHLRRLKILGRNGDHEAKNTQSIQQNILPTSLPQQDEKMTVTKTKSGFFAGVGSFFDKYWGIIANVVGAVILGFSTNLVSSVSDLFDVTRRQTWLEYVGIILFCNGAFLLAREGFRASQLRDENVQLGKLIKCLGDDIQDKWRQMLIQVFDELDLKNNCRISIYRHEADNFIMLGRFSHDPVMQKTGRGYYPVDQGCIGKAFREGESFALEIPDPTCNEYYEVMQAEWGIDPAVATTFAMKARSIAAFALADRATLKRSLILVFESAEPKAFTKKHLRTVRDKYADTFCGLEKALEPLLPSLHYAKLKGF